MSKHFDLEPTGDFKRVLVQLKTDENFRFAIDTDDVEKLDCAVYTQKLLAILDAHWDAPEYAHFTVPDWPDFGDDEDEENYADTRFAEGTALWQTIAPH